MSLPEPAQLVPHRDQALLLETIESIAEDGLVASLVVRADAARDRESGTMPAWLGPEIMAQAVSAFATSRSGPPYRPQPGLLLGVRSYRSSAAGFRRGATIRVSVRESTCDGEGRAVFDAVLAVDGVDTADAMLTVYQPDDFLAALEGQIA